MGAYRQTYDLFFYLGQKKSHRYYPWNNNFRGWFGLLRNRLFWHDTLGKRWNRLVGCRRKHKKVKMIPNDGGFDVIAFFELTLGNNLV